MRVLRACLMAVIWSGDILAARGTAPVTASGYFWVSNGQRLPQRVVASSVGRSLRRCLAECLRVDGCRHVCYEETAGQCALEDARVVPVAERQAMPLASIGCDYYTKEVCSTTSPLNNYQRKFPLPAFDGETVVLDFAVKAHNAAMLLFSTDPGNAGLQYELVFNVGGRTIIRKCLQCSTLTGVPSPGVISQTELRRFWLHYDGGSFTLGKHGEQAYLEWTTTPSNPVRFVGFGAYDAPQTWVVYHTCP